jgi:hypothetical protein
VSTRIRRTALWGALIVTVISGSVVVGHATVNSDSARASGYSAGESDGHYRGYLAGLRDGEVQGLQDGRAQQEASRLPRQSRHRVRAAFHAGYAAGANDVFAGYDGGWALAVPYLVTMEKAAGPIAYRIGSRTTLEPNVTYFLCPNRVDLCQQPSQ